MDDRAEFAQDTLGSPAPTFSIDRSYDPSAARSPVVIRYETMIAAQELVERESVILESIDETGKLIGQVSPPGRRSVPTEVTIRPSGHFDAEAHSPYAVATVLRLISILSSRKRTKAAKTLLAGAPSWLTEDFRFDATIDREIEVAGRKGITELKSLQAFWALLDIASGKTGTVPVAMLIELVLTQYGAESWHMQRTAMDAALSRIASAEAEGLKIGSRPDEPPLGQYRVRRPRESLRPYEVLIASGTRLAASCSCPDYAKNTLRFCKHIAAIYLDCFARERTKKQMATAKGLESGMRLIWEPLLGLTSVDDPAEGLFLVANGRGAPKALANFFTRPCGTRLGLEGLPPRSESSMRLKYFDGLKVALRGPKSLLVDPSVAGIMDREIERARWPTAFIQHADAFSQTIDNLKLKLYPYQREGVLRALCRGRFLLGDDMGLGKTTQAIAWAEALLTTQTVRRVLVICPASLKPQWRREWELVSGRRVTIVGGMASERHAAYQSNAEVMLINYELILRDIDVIPASEFEAVILDEAQRIKNYTTQTSAKVKRLKPPFRLILTGTPMENRVSEFASLMEWIDSDALGPYWRMEAETAYHDGVGQGKKGIRGLNMIRQRAAPHFLRRTRKEVLTELPARTDSEIAVEASEAQLTIHADFAAKVARLVAILEQRALSPEEHIRLMSYLTQMRIVSNGMAQFEFDDAWTRIGKDRPSERTLESLDSPKLSVFRGLLEGLVVQDGVKIVVFSQWRRALKLAHWAITDILAANNAEAVFFTGAEDLKRRTENIVRFHNDPDVRVFFATDAGGVGLNLQRAATVCVNFELPWNPAVLEQRIGRIYRLGQDRPVQIFNLVTQETIETRITGLIAQKRAVFDALFDGMSDEVRFDESGSFMNQVREVVATFAGGEARSAATDELIESSEPERLADMEMQETLVASTSDDEPEDAAMDETPSPNNVATETPKQAAGSGSVGTEHVINIMRGVKFERTQDGTIRIEADGPAASVLSEAFMSMARMFGALAGSGGGGVQSDVH